MGKTLADMTQDECETCHGMWVSYTTPVGDEIAIYLGGTTLFEPGYGAFKMPHACITPRYDLPRAWNADGTPAH